MGRQPGSKNKTKTELALEAKILLDKIKLMEKEKELQKIKEKRRDGK